MKRRLLPNCFVLSLFVFNVTFAAEVALETSFETTEILGTQEAGQVTVSVLNLSGDEIHNVDLRAGDGGLITLGRGIIQVGRIPAGEVGVATGSFMAEQGILDSEQPVIWRIDFDDVVGNHKQMQLMAY